MTNSTANNQGVSPIRAPDTEKTRSGRDLAIDRQRTMLTYLAALCAELGAGS